MSEAKREALWLAEKMDFSEVEAVYGCVFYTDENGACCEFEPHTNKAQFADVLLWAWLNGYESTINGCRARVGQYAGLRGAAVESEGLDEASIMAATLTAICRASGYQGE